MGPEIVNLAGTLGEVLAIDPKQPALEFERRWWTWEDIRRQTNAIVGTLATSGLGAGHRIAVLMRNRPEIALTLVALLERGYCLVTIDATAPDPKLAAEIGRAGAPALLALPADWERGGILEAAAAISAIGFSLTGREDQPLIAMPNLSGDSSRWRSARADGIAVEMLSSGTTGTPKRIPLSSVNLERALLSAAMFEQGREAGSAPRLRSGVHIINGPLAHISGITGVMNNLLAGRKVCLLDKFTVKGFEDALIRHRPKVATAPPAALRMLLDADVRPDVFSSLVALRTGTAPLDPEIVDRFYERYQLPVLQNYGATEFAGGVAGWTLGEFRSLWKVKHGSVGRLNSGVEARIIDVETDASLPVNQEGILEIKAPNIDAGRSWLRTTDLAMLDEDRFLWLRGRADGAIIRGGFKVLPEDVQRAANGHPAVLETAVVGLTDQRLGQVPVMAWIAKTGRADTGESELRAFLRERLMPYQIPVHIIQLEDFPRTASMKVSQPALRARILDILERRQ